MTIFGDNIPASNDTAFNCGFEVHHRTRLDLVLNIVFGIVMIFLAVFSMFCNSGVLIYFYKRAVSQFNEFERIRKSMTIARASIDLLYNTRTLYIAYILLESSHEPLCGSEKPIGIVIMNIFTYSTSLLSMNMTFLLALLNCANIKINPFKIDFKHSYRIIVSIFTIVNFLLIFILELEGPIRQHGWFSPIQIPFHGHQYSRHNILKWCLFASKLAFLLLHLIVLYTSRSRLNRLFRMIKIQHANHVYQCMILLVVGNCVVILLSLIKDLVTNFLDFDITLSEKLTKIHPYEHVYLLFFVDVFMFSLLSTYNPLVFIRSSTLVRRTIYKAMTEAVSFTGLSGSKKHSRTNGHTDSIDRCTSGSRQYLDENSHGLRRGSTRRICHTLTVTFWTNSVEFREPVSGTNVTFPLNHIPSKPSISIPVVALQYPSKLMFVGRGSFGKVYQYTDNTVGCSVAIKHIELRTNGVGCEIEDVKKEVRINSKLSHSNIVQYVGCCDSKMSSWCIIMEYMKRGSLRGLLLSIRDKSFNRGVQTEATTRTKLLRPILNDSSILKYSKEMLSGLSYLHANNIIHRDLRAANVLISSANIAKLGDFGLSKKLEAVTKSAGDYTPDVGNPFWGSPEALMNDDCGPPVDIWSFGITLLEMIWVNPPFMSQRAFRYVYALCKHKHIPEIPSFVEEKVRIVLTQCLQFIPQDRPTSDQMLISIEEMVSEPVTSSYLSIPSLSRSASNSKTKLQSKDKSSCGSFKKFNP